MIGRSAIVWALATAVVVLATYAPQLGTPFELQDDHRIIAPLLGGGTSWLREIHTDFYGVGRFRPVNQIFDVYGPLVLGPNPMLWHAISLALAVTVALLLFAIGWEVFRSATAAAMFSLITMLAPDPGPTTAWYRLGPKEAWGMLFLAIALLLMIRKRWAASFVFVVLCAYSKESFVLLIPALLAIEWWLRGRRPPWTRTLAYALLLLLGLGAMLFALRHAGAASYGAGSLARSPIAIARVAMSDLARAPMLAAWFLPALLGLIALVRRRAWRAIATAIVLALIWIGPQYALYATRGGFWDHYWLPCVVVFAAVNAAGLAVLERNKAATGVAALQIVFAIWALNAIRIDVSAVRNFKARATMQQAAVRLATQHVRPDSVLVIVADPKTQYGEVAPAFAQFVRANGGRFHRAILTDSCCPARVMPDVSVVVHLDPRTRQPLVSGFARREVRGVQEYLSLRRRGWVEVPFGITMDVRR